MILLSEIWGVSGKMADVTVRVYHFDSLRDIILDEK